MYKNILIVASALILTGCATGPKLADCGGPARQVTIHYGDSQIRVSPPVINLARAEELRFRLRPDKKASDEVDFDTILVTVKGKTDDADWIDLSGTYDDTGGYMGVCVPDDIEIKVYKYLVDVNTVGEIDPRADVKR